MAKSRETPAKCLRCAPLSPAEARAKHPNCWDDKLCTARRFYINNRDRINQKRARKRIETKHQIPVPQVNYGACPLCVREVNFLKGKDGDRGLIKFVDIAAEDYDPTDNANIDFETAMGRIHAVLPNGEIVRDVEVFRQIYDLLGIGWIYAVTKLPVIGRLADAIYGIWADYRLLLTGRANLNTIVAQRQQLLKDRESGVGARRFRGKLPPKTSLGSLSIPLRSG